MATIVAVRSGNWSDTSHVTGPWPGESTPTTKPGVGDTVQTDEYIITIDEDVTVALLESTSTGYFSVTDAPTLPAVRAITANVLNSGMANWALQISNSTGLVVQTGNATGGVNYGHWGIYNSGAMGDFTGNVYSGGGESAYGLVNEGVMGDFTGNVYGGSNEGETNAYGLFNAGVTGVMGDFTGNVYGGGGVNSYGIFNNSGTMGDFTGNVYLSLIHI